MVGVAKEDGELFKGDLPAIFGQISKLIHSQTSNKGLTQTGKTEVHLHADLADA